MATVRSMELAEQADIQEEQGKQELADELSHLASFGADTDESETVSDETNQAQFDGLLLSEVEEDTIDWLWRNWLQLGCLSFFVGPAGGEKSTILSDLIARVTRGDVMPDGTACEAPGGAVIISLEEKTASVVRPRLRKAGADLTHVIDLSRVPRTVVSPGDPASSPFMLPDDLPVLERAIKRVNASLVVIDPLMSAVNPRISTFRNQSARQIVTTFQDLAERLGITVVIANHFVKGSTKDPLSAMAGSKGLSDIVRSAFMLSPDGSNAARRVLSLIKHNNAPEVSQIVLEHNGSNVKYLTGVTAAQSRINEAEALSQSRKRVLAMLADEPTREFTPSELAQRADVHYDSMKSVLRRMAASGQIVKTARGFYQALPEKTPAPTAPSAPLQNGSTGSSTPPVPTTKPVEGAPAPFHQAGAPWVDPISDTKTRVMPAQTAA